MKGIIPRSAVALCLGVFLSALTGCVHYRNLVDPCWPERWNQIARDSVRHMHNVQADKGHMFDQTIWNWMFESDPKTGIATDRLNGAGIEQLKIISRRMPVPDYHIFIQNAQDIPYLAGMPPEQLVQARAELNNRRITAIQRFLATQLAPHGGVYSIGIHDFAPPGLPANPIVGATAQPPAQGAYQKLENNFQGVLTIQSGSGAAAAPGGTGAR